MDEIVALTHEVVVDKRMRRRLARGMTRWRRTRPRYWRLVALRTSTFVVMLGGVVLLLTRSWWISVPFALVVAALGGGWVLWTDHRAILRRLGGRGDVTVRIGLGADAVRVVQGDLDVTTGHGYYRAVHVFGDVVVFETRPPTVGVTASPREIFSDAEVAHLRERIAAARPAST